jgi:ABC-type glycerol-3-phosphate transport system permease component
MNFKNLHNKAQSLPLNTIVIAILVVIVLLIIIVTFTDSFTGSNEAIGDATSCSPDNPSLSNYQLVRPSDSCDLDGEERIFTARLTEQQKEQGSLCCGTLSN